MWIRHFGGSGHASTPLTRYHQAEDVSEKKAEKKEHKPWYVGGHKYQDKLNDKHEHKGVGTSKGRNKKKDDLED